jgi:hypothetical protein
MLPGRFGAANISETSYENRSSPSSLLHVLKQQIWLLRTYSYHLACRVFRFHE